MLIAPPPLIRAGKTRQGGRRRGSNAGSSSSKRERKRGCPPPRLHSNRVLDRLLPPRSHPLPGTTEDSGVANADSHPPGQEDQALTDPNRKRHADPNHRANGVPVI